MKKPALIIGAVSLAVIISMGLNPFFKNREKKTDYIFDKSHNISLSDIEKTITSSIDKPEDYKPVFKTSDSGSKEEFRINNTTITFFKSLERINPESRDINEHLEGVKTYLYSKYPPNQAELIFQNYKTYITCEMEISREVNFSTINSYSPEEVINSLRNIQEMRRARMGNELADALFGSKVKSAEYSIRKSAIMESKDMYGLEKEEALGILNEDMWGDDKFSLNRKSSKFNLYREKLKLYQKDLKEAGSDREYKAMIKEFRKEFFEPEAIERMEADEKKREEEDKKEEHYYLEEKKILESNEFDDKEKALKLRELQDELFGDQADNFRARLSLKAKK